MTASTISLKASADDQRIAKLAALAIVLSIAEAAIPSPVPGVKPGLANIVTLIVLQRLGLRAAVWVALLRVTVSSLFLGTFLSPGFVLSFSGALASLAVLAVAIHLPERWFGALSHSVLAAFAHLAAQLAVVYFWLIPTTSLGYLIPIFALAALVFGAANGFVAMRFMANVPNSNPPAHA